MKQRYDVREWDGTLRSVFASGKVLIKVEYCGGTVHEVTKNYFEKVLLATKKLPTDPFYHVEGCRCKGANKVSKMS